MTIQAAVNFYVAVILSSLSQIPILFDLNVFLIIKRGILGGLSFLGFYKFLRAYSNHKSSTAYNLGDLLALEPFYWFGVVAALVTGLAQLIELVLAPCPKEATFVFGNSKASTNTYFNNTAVYYELRLEKCAKYACSPKIELSLRSKSRCMMVANNILNIAKLSGNWLVGLL